MSVHIDLNRTTSDGEVKEDKDEDNSFYYSTSSSAPTHNYLTHLSFYLYTFCRYRLSNISLVQTLKNPRDRLRKDLTAASRKVTTPLSIHTTSYISSVVVSIYISSSALSPYPPPQYPHTGLPPTPRLRRSHDNLFFLGTENTHPVVWRISSRVGFWRKLTTQLNENNTDFFVNVKADDVDKDDEEEDNEGTKTP